jgi:hypothetical protein
LERWSSRGLPADRVSFVGWDATKGEAGASPFVESGRSTPGDIDAAPGDREVELTARVDRSLTVVRPHRPVLSSDRYWLSHKSLRLPATTVHSEIDQMISRKIR